MMKTVISTSYLERTFGIEKALDMIAEAGFDGIDYSDEAAVSSWDDYKELAIKIRTLAEERGLAVCQTHAPIPTQLLKDRDVNYVKKVVSRSIEFSGILGAYAAVVHPIQSPLHKLGDESVYLENMDYFRYLLPYCKEYNVKIAIENMCYSNPKGKIPIDGVCANPLEFAKYIDDLDSEYVTGCLDTGHCAVTGREPQDVLRILGGDRITCLHIHDNDYKSDMHYLPYTMKLEWDEILKALADINYKGHFTMEASFFLPKFPKDFLPVALKFKCDVAKYMVSTINKYIT